MSVSIKPAGAELQVGTPVRLFQSGAFQDTRDYDVSSNDRFLLNIPITDRTALPLTVILNLAAGPKK
ncbi:MAG: hypothetical protein ACRD2N_03070 [Vicinamibacterales bacterium]